VSCETCREIYEVDEVAPDCQTERGCPIPQLSPDEARIIEIRKKIQALSGLVPAEVVLRMYSATLDDLELLSVVEEELKNLSTKEQPQGENDESSFQVN